MTTNPTDHQHDISVEPHWSICLVQLTSTSLQSMEYQRCEAGERGLGSIWAANTRNPKVSTAITYPDNYDNIFTCFTNTKSSHHIPWSYKHAIVSDRE
jgi:hypothetical protein